MTAKGLLKKEGEALNFMQDALNDLEFIQAQKDCTTAFIEPIVGKFRVVSIHEVSGHELVWRDPGESIVYVQG